MYRKEIIEFLKHQTCTVSGLAREFEVKPSTLSR